MLKLIVAVTALFGATGTDAAAAFITSKPAAVTTCNRFPDTKNVCKSHRQHPGGGGRTMGNWIRADDRPITLHVENGGGKRFLKIPVSFVSQVMTLTNSSSNHDQTTEATARVEAMVEVTMMMHGQKKTMTSYPPKVTMLERDQKLTVTADNLACLVEMEDQWGLCSEQSDPDDCDCGVNVALAVEQTVATTFDFYVYPIVGSGIAEINVYYRLSGSVKVDGDGTLPNNSAYSAAMVYNTVSAKLLQMPEWEYGYDLSEDYEQGQTLLLEKH